MQCQAQRRAPFPPLQQAEAEKLTQALCACFHSPPGLFSKLRSPPFRRSLLSYPPLTLGDFSWPQHRAGKRVTTTTAIGSVWAGCADPGSSTIRLPGQLGPAAKGGAIL
ncbi:unnamed protein product [Natator depressus]